LTCF